MVESLFRRKRCINCFPSSHRYGQFYVEVGTFLVKFLFTFCQKDDYKKLRIS